VRIDGSDRSGYHGQLKTAASGPGISEGEQAAEVQPTTKDVLEAREFLESVLDNSTQYSLIGKDLARRITAWNKGAAGIYGYEASEVIGRSSDILHVPEEIRSGAVEELHQRAQAEGLAAGLFRRRRKRVRVSREADGFDTEGCPRER
jgi:PAS domain S-box-containing protein